MWTRETILEILETICDPEVPVLSILDLGIVRDIQIISPQHIVITITPTYSGCPAMNTIAMAIRMEFLSRGVEQVDIHEVLSPAWTTDWMSENGKQKLRAYGIAPPQYQHKDVPAFGHEIVPCPICQSTHTEALSQFGSTSCKALYRCLDCLEPFDYFKCH